MAYKPSDSSLNGGSEPQASAERLPPGQSVATAWELIASFAQVLGVNVDAPSLALHFSPSVSPESCGEVDLGLVAEALQACGLSVQPSHGGVAALPKDGSPTLGRSASGQLLMVAAISGSRYLVHFQGHDRPHEMSAQTLDALCPGQWLKARVADPASALAPSSKRKFGLSWFGESLREYKALLGEVLLASFFIQVFALLTPLIFQVVIDKVLTHRSMTTLDVMVAALLGVSVFEIILAGLRHYLFSHTTNRVDMVLGARLFRHLMHLPLSYFDSRRSGDTVARVRELENARGFMTGPALTSWLDLFFAVVFLAVMFQYSVPLTLIVIAALPVLFAASWLITPLMRRKLEDMFALGAENQSFLVETVTSMETLKSHAVEDVWQRDWERRLKAYTEAAFASGHLGNATNQFISLASKALTVVLLYVGAKLVIDGELTVGGLIAFNMLAGRVNAPILKLASLWQEFNQMKLSVQRLGDILDAPAEPAFRSGRANPPPLLGRLTFEHTTFRYAQGLPEVLFDLVLDIQAGEVVGITGISGAGKTTFMRLVQRLYVPERGRILLDGMDLGLLDTAWLRRQIGVVGQDTLLFNRSVRENIAFGDASISSERVFESARLAGAHEFILNLPDGYDTVIGERGGRLSGGQRSRLAIARALVTNPRLLLLDEATAALDYESERAVHDNMAQICRGRTVLIVAHRLSTLRLADRILVLDKGRLVEAGNHAQLMELKGRYSGLYRAHQVLEAA